MVAAEQVDSSAIGLCAFVLVAALLLFYLFCLLQFFFFL